MAIYRDFKRIFHNTEASVHSRILSSILDIYIDLSLRLIHVVGVKLNSHYIWYVLT